MLEAEFEDGGVLADEELDVLGVLGETHSALEHGF